MGCPRTRSGLPSDIGPTSVVHDSVVVMTAVHVPKKHEIEEMHAKMVELKITMADRRHGGGGKSGRYKKHDTARLAFINGRGFHDLRYGRLPTVENQRRLFELPGDDDIKGSEKLDMDAWSKEIHPDPRSKAAADAGLDKARQTTLLEYVSQHPGAFTVPANAPRGAPAAYKLVGVHKHYNGCTVMQMARDGRSHHLKPDAPVPGGPTLHWFASAAFSWRFPQHTRLFLGLLQLERNGTAVQGNGQYYAPPDTTRARAKYSEWAAPELAPRAGAPQQYPTGGLSDEPPPPGSENLLEYVEIEPAFASANFISGAQTTFFNETVEGMASRPYRRWPRLWAEPPDATCLPTFDPSTAAAWELLPICFWSPERKWAHVGIRTPCARHGCARLA